MSSTATNTPGGTTRSNLDGQPRRRVSTETKASFKTTELIAYVAAVIGVLIAASVVDGKADFTPQDAWRLITFLTIGYMISRGLAKSGSRDFYDDESSNH